MTKQEALDCLRVHLTKLYSKSDIYEDGTCDLISALEEFAIPMLEKDIEQDCLVEAILDKYPYAFDRVNIMSASELKHTLGLYE